MTVYPRQMIRENLTKTSGFSMALLIIAIIILPIQQSRAGELTVAVAGNFTDAIKTISERFETKTGHNITLIFGSTGKHYAQIKHGAPFDVFFAADICRPELLENEGIALSGSRFTYAIGKVVLWSPEIGYVDPEGTVLKNNDFRHLAIANPKLAPYGMAAQEVLQTRGVWDKLVEKIVRGENINQTFQFVMTGNAELGFVAYSQIKHPGKPVEGSYWDIPQVFYTPIEQQAVLLRDSEIARDFLRFVRSEEALDIIHGYGYDTP